MEGSRRMKYPYTISAKIAQFPHRFYFEKSRHYRWWFYGMAASLPLFFWISSVANSPANIRAAEEKKRKEAEHHH
ncbi:hypothetical protein QYM36_006884 [Artemia franciscana]|uniref:Uncharacterized protein n=1 Tax=Artemia franciscana TaxID=6661 RepID=A0AA88I1S3_ARTSF|nr:hypothetical protein QYM36_006884 [Artemia franciscana]KAK2716550.1 hypothetical protein QYM36_006884 [Artemia franciscana]KAK2716551.1 hypothetical protein QYM36_006884 [Artemia franciscana]